jgi:hypothetical protein
MECIEYWKVKGHVAAAESPANTYLFGHSVDAWSVINRRRNPKGFSFSPVADTRIDPIEFPSTVASAAARGREISRAPPPPATGAAPEWMRVKTPCSWRMKASPSKGSKVGGKKRSHS